MGIQLQSASLPKYIKVLEAVKLFAKWNNTPLDKTMLDALGIHELAKSRIINYRPGKSGGSIWRLL